MSRDNTLQTNENLYLSEVQSIESISDTIRASVSENNTPGDAFLSNISHSRQKRLTGGGKISRAIAITGGFESDYDHHEYAQAADDSIKSMSSWQLATKNVFLGVTLPKVDTDGTLITFDGHASYKKILVASDPGAWIYGLCDIVTEWLSYCEQTFNTSKTNPLLKLNDSFRRALVALVMSRTIDVNLESVEKIKYWSESYIHTMNMMSERREDQNLVGGGDGFYGSAPYPPILEHVYAEPPKTRTALLLETNPTFSSNLKENRMVLAIGVISLLLIALFVTFSLAVAFGVQKQHVQELNTILKTQSTVSKRSLSSSPSDLIFKRLPTDSGLPDIVVLGETAAHPPDSFTSGATAAKVFGERKRKAITVFEDLHSEDPSSRLFDLVVNFISRHSIYTTKGGATGRKVLASEFADFNETADPVSSNNITVSSHDEPCNHTGSVTFTGGYSFHYDCVGGPRMSSEFLFRLERTPPTDACNQLYPNAPCECILLSVDHVENTTSCCQYCSDEFVQTRTNMSHVIPCGCVVLSDPRDVFDDSSPLLNGTLKYCSVKAQPQLVRYINNALNFSQVAPDIVSLTNGSTKGNITTFTRNVRPYTASDGCVCTARMYGESCYKSFFGTDTFRTLGSSPTVIDEAQCNRVCSRLVGGTSVYRDSTPITPACVWLSTRSHFVVRYSSQRTVVNAEAYTADALSSSGIQTTVPWSHGRFIIRSGSPKAPYQRLTWGTSTAILRPYWITGPRSEFELKSNVWVSPDTGRSVGFNEESIMTRITNSVELNLHSDPLNANIRYMLEEPIVEVDEALMPILDELARLGVDLSGVAPREMLSLVNQNGSALNADLISVSQSLLAVIRTTSTKSEVRSIISRAQNSKMTLNYVLENSVIDATAIARTLSLEPTLCAHFAGDSLRVWPAILLEDYTILPRGVAIDPSMCYRDAMVKFELNGNSNIGFLRPMSREVVRSSPVEACMDTEAIYLATDDERFGKTFVSVKSESIEITSDGYSEVLVGLVPASSASEINLMISGTGFYSITDILFDGGVPFSQIDVISSIQVLSQYVNMGFNDSNNQTSSGFNFGLDGGIGAGISGPIGNAIEDAGTAFATSIIVTSVIGVLFACAFVTGITIFLCFRLGCCSNMCSSKNSCWRKKKDKYAGFISNPAPASADETVFTVEMNPLQKRSTRTNQSVASYHNQAKSRRKT